ncbi:MAG: metallophosphoesterase family protein [Akkermansiaceae bacterium]
MKVKRRTFLRNSAVCGTFGFGGRVAGSSGLNDTISASFSEIDFDPAEPGSGFIVVLTDLHMAPSFENLRTKEIDPRIIEEVNGMDPGPEMIIVAGDLATAATVFTGKTFTKSDEALARNELEIGMAQLSRFNPEIEIKIIPGNHDTYNFEEDAQLWSEYSKNDPYQTFQFHGLKFILLNSGHAGSIDPKQQFWFEAEVASASEESEIYVFMHQPLGSFISGRAMNQSFSRAFRNYRGKVWAGAGHVHVFRFGGYKIHDHCSVVQNITATGSPVAFNGDGKSPGYSLICVKDGKVIHHFHRDVKGGDLVAPPNPDRTEKFPKLPDPFDGLAYPLLICEEGEYRREDYLREITGWDVNGLWWSYVHSLELEFDLSLYRGMAHQLALLGSYTSSFQLISEFSSDGGDTWLSAENSLVPGKFIYTTIPKAMRSSESVRVRFSTDSPRYSFNFFLGGFSLVPDPGKISRLDDWRWENFGTILDEGKAASREVAPKGGCSNLEKFAYGIPVESSGRPLVDPQSGVINGLPKLTRNATGKVSYQFVRRREKLNLGMKYRVMMSNVLPEWEEVDPESFEVSALNEDWELVEISGRGGKNLFYRVELLVDRR